jgi:phenylpropionate dioxygenase-like ring-hydroxylating dioxygenase large terminal subunit
MDAEVLERRPLPRGCTFAESDWRILARFWHPVALVRDVDAAPVAAKLLDVLLIVYRAGDGGIVVANDLCPHRGVPLSLGGKDEHGVVCAYHGLRFGAGGKCRFIPANPATEIPDKLNLTTYPAIERYGLVWTCLDPSDSADPPMLPPMPHWDEPAFQQIVCPSIDIFGAPGRQMEGFLDVAHFGFVHASTFGDPGNAEVPAYKPEPHRFGFEVRYWSSVGNYPIGSSQKGQTGFDWLRHFNVHLPFNATLEIHFPDEGRLVIMNAASPMSARATRLFAPIARNFDKDLPVQDVYDFNQRIFEEDKAIVEAQRPEDLPLDPRLEAHIPADRSSIAYRKGLRELGLGAGFTS